MEELHKMVHLIIINLFDHSGVWIWNIFRVRFNWKIWRVKLNITIINGTMIKSPHDSWNYRTGFGRRGTGFEVICWRLDVPISWWISWLITTKGIELIHLSSKNWWEEVRAMDDAGIRLVTNTPTAFTNIFLSHADRFNNWMESWCIIVYGR